MEVLYKTGIVNGYAKIQEGKVILIIPFSQKNNKLFLQEMQLLGEKMENKLRKKKQIEIFLGDSVLLFGEYLKKSDIGIEKEKQWHIFFQQELYNFANPILQVFANRIGYNNIPLKIKKVKSKRGSCTSDKHIMLNETLVHLPTRYIKYVVAHEVSHLKEMNHSKKFWERVEQLYPNSKRIRKELKNIIIT